MKRLLGLVLLLAVSVAWADPTAGDRACHGAFFNPATDICWSCIFPISLGGARIAKMGKLPDTKNPKSPLGMCNHSPCLKVGFWEPIRLIDVTRTPGCMVSLGGHRINGFSKYLDPGGIHSRSAGVKSSFYYTHMITLNLMDFLSKDLGLTCVDPVSISGEIYWSEIDPTWVNDILALLMAPEAVLVFHPLVQAACAAEVIKVGLGHLPINALFWCLGGQGGVFPLSGNVGAHVGEVQASVLLAERLIYMKHRMGEMYDTDPKKICKPRKHKFMPKSRYRIQMVCPVASVSKRHGCKPFGYPTVLWGAGRAYPIKGEDFSYLIWRKRNCCTLRVSGLDNIEDADDENT